MPFKSRSGCSESPVSGQAWATQIVNFAALSGCRPSLFEDATTPLITAELSF
jgi:hypothetical protein